MGLSTRTILTCDKCGAYPLGGDKGVSLSHEPVLESPMPEPIEGQPEAPPPKKVDPEGMAFYRVTMAEAELMLCSECFRDPKIQSEFWQARKVIANGVA